MEALAQTYLPAPGYVEQISAKERPTNIERETHCHRNVDTIKRSRLRILKKEPMIQLQMITPDPPVERPKSRPIDTDGKTETTVKQKVNDIRPERPRLSTSF
jgi:hypothetical protein